MACQRRHTRHSFAPGRNEQLTAPLLCHGRPHLSAALAVERLLAEGANPWAKDCNQRLPLHFAAEAGHLACVRSLIPWMRRQAPRPAAAAAGAGAAPQAADAAGGGSSGSTSSGGKKEVAGPLDIPDQNGQTPVQLAAEHGHPDCAALLLDDAEGTGEGKRCTALHLAAAQGRASVVQQLLAPSHRRLVQPSAKDADGWAALHHAAARGHKEVVQALLAAQVELDDVAADGDTALHKAALGGFLGIAVVRSCGRGDCCRWHRNCRGVELAAGVSAPCCRFLALCCGSGGLPSAQHAPLWPHHPIALPRHCRSSWLAHGASWTSATPQVPPRCTTPPARATSWWCAIWRRRARTWMPPPPTAARPSTLLLTTALWVSGPPAAAGAVCSAESYCAMQPSLRVWHLRPTNCTCC